MATILLVDDEPNILKLSSFIVKSLGHTVHTASDGKQALQFLETTPVDLVISDLIMPEIGGFELCAVLKNKYPIVIVSAMSNEFKPDIPYTTGALDFIQKPFDVAYIRQRLPILLQKLKKNDLPPILATTVAGQPVYKGENILVVGKTMSDIETAGLPLLQLTKPEHCSIEYVSKQSELLGQTTQQRAGGLRVMENISISEQADFIASLNKTNMAVGDITGIFLSPSTVEDKYLKLFDRVLA